MTDFLALAWVALAATGYSRIVRQNDWLPAIFIGTCTAVAFVVIITLIGATS